MVRAGQATLLGARAAAAQFASVREMSQAAEAAIRLQAQIAETEAEADTFRRAMGIMADDRKTDIDQASARERRRHRARRKYERKMISVWKDRFEATHDAYVAKLQFEAPVDLWTKAARKHSDAARTALQTFLALAAAFGGGGVLLALLFGDHLARAYLVENCDSGSSVCKAAFSAKGPLVTGAILLAASFAIWVLRTIHRMYVSERHLAGSADEKRAFAETYLALIKDQNVSRDQEAIVLAALFRPGGDGLPGEENSVIDISSAAILAKVVSGSPGR